MEGSRLGDSERIGALLATGLLDAPRDPAFDRLTDLVRVALEVPVSLISLVGETRQFFMSCPGLAEPWATRRGSPLSHSFCRHVVETGEPLIVEDAREAPLLRDNPVIETMGAVAYLGFPLETRSGHLLGSLCAIAHEPRAWTDRDLRILRGITESVASEIHLRMEADAREAAEARADALAREQEERDAAGASDRRLASVLESISDGFVSLDRRWRYTYVNEKAGELLGRDPATLVGKHAWTEFPLAVDHPVREAAERAMAEQVPVRAEGFYEAQGRWYENRISPSPEGISIFFTDITADKTAEDRLRRQATYYQSLIENAVDLISLVDVDGTVLYESPSVERMLGYAPEEMEGRSGFDFIHPDEHPYLHARLGRLVEDPDETVSVRFRMRHRDGSWRWFEAEGRNLLADPAVGAIVVNARDVTGRVETEEALRESEERFRLAARAARDLIYDWDVRTGEITWSDALRQVLGHDGLTETDIGWWEAQIHPEDRGPVAETLTEVIEGGEEFWSGTYRFRAEDGEYITFHDRGYIVRDVEGAAVRMVGSMTDITEEIAAEQALRESEERFRQIAESVRDVFWIAEPDFTRIHYVSPAFRDVWGLDPEELERNPLRFVDVVWEEDRPALFQAMEQAARSIVSAVEYRITTPSGENRWLRSRAVPVSDAAGRVFRVAGTTEDVTRERRAVDELRFREALLEAQSEASLDGILVVNIDDRAVYSNRAFAEMWEIPAAMLQGGPIKEAIRSVLGKFVDPEDAAACVQEIYENPTRRARKELLLRDGRIIDRYTAPVEGPSGELYGRVWFFRDVTEERERERRLRRAERLAGLGTLVGGVAHELNNPLTAIRSFADLLLAESRPAEEREDLETIRREADRMAAVVSSLRLLARETQQKGAERSAVDLNDVVRHVVKVRRYVLDTHNVEVVEEMDEGIPPVWASRSEIEQVLLNLVVNAEQALSANGIGERRIVLRTFSSRLGAGVQVADNGPGIPPELLPRIFDPFFTTKEPGEGTGLGLSLAHTLVTEHGGDLRVESQPGRRTAFIVELPRAPAAATGPSAPEGRAGTSGALRILVVDDEAAIRRSLQRFLERRGHRVEVAGDGEEALALLHREGTYDVILSDLRMPGLGGEELLRRLREEGSGHDKRVVFMTGDAAGEDAARILRASAVPVVEKPFVLSEVAERIELHAAARGPG